MKKTLIHAAIRSNIIRIFNKYTKGKAVIFMLHRFSDPSIGYTWEDSSPSAELLERCFSYLRKYDYTVLSLKEVIKKITNDQKLYKTVCFTVDDGYIDFKNIACPLCKKYNIPATVFITTDFIDGKIMMWWDKIEYLIKNTAKDNLDATLPEPINRVSMPLRSRQEKNNAVELLTTSLKAYTHNELLAFIQKLSISLEVLLPEKVPLEYSALTWEDAQVMHSHKIDFEPHTVTHPILSRLSETEQQQQIRDSIVAIKDNLKTIPAVFCYPNGTVDDFTENTIDIVRSAGVPTACTSERGFFGSELEGQLHRIPRIPFPGRFEQFVLWISGYRAKFSTTPQQ